MTGSEPPGDSPGTGRQVRHCVEPLDGEVALHEDAELLAHLGQHLAQSRARAHDGGDRVVQLVGQAGAPNGMWTPGLATLHATGRRRRCGRS